MPNGKFHVNKETGRAGACHATKKGCPLGEGTPHFDTKEQAKEYIEKDAAANNNQFGTVSKKKANPKVQANGDGNRGGNNNKTLVGTPDPENNNLGENIAKEMSRLKLDLDGDTLSPISKDDRGVGHSDESQNIARLYNDLFKDGINRKNIEDFKYELAERSIYLDRVAGNISEEDEEIYGTNRDYYLGGMDAVEGVLDRVLKIDKDNASQPVKSSSVKSGGNAPKYHSKKPLSPMQQHIKNGGPMPGEKTHYATREEAIAAAESAKMNSRNTSATNFTDEQVENYREKLDGLLNDQVKNAAIEVDVDYNNADSYASIAAFTAREANYEHQLRVQFLYNRAFNNGSDINKENIEKFKKSLVDAEKGIDNFASKIEDEETRRIYTMVQKDAFKETFRQLNDIDNGGIGVHPLSQEYPKSVSTPNEIRQYAKLNSRERDTYDKMYENDRRNGGNKPHEELMWDSIYKNVSPRDRETLVTADGSFKYNYLTSRASGVSHTEALRGLSEFKEKQRGMSIKDLGDYTRLLAKNKNNYDKTNKDFFGNK